MPMRGISTITERELAGAFGRPQGYVVIGVFIALVALFTLWFDDVLRTGTTSMRRPFIWMSACLLFLVPATTMGALADERRSGRMLLLASLPWSNGTLVLGKWLSSVAMLGIALGLTLPWPAMLATYGPLDWGPVFAGYLGLFLAGGALAAVGLAASAAVERQVSAFLLTLAVAMIPYLIGWGLPLVPLEWVALVQYVSFDFHFDNLARGVLDSRSVVFFGSIMAVFLRLATYLLERQRLT